jgi:hypothetical protein
LNRIDNVVPFGVGLVEQVKIDSSGKRELFAIQHSQHAGDKNQSIIVRGDITIRELEVS